MRHYESNLREAKRHRVQIDRIGEPHVERRRQAERFANADAQHAAVNESGSARMRGKQFEQCRDAVVLDGIAMHGRKKAERVNVTARERGFHLGGGAGRGRIHHHVSVESLGMLAHRGHHGLAVAGNARDQRSFRDAVPIQLLDPGVGKLPGIFGAAIASSGAAPARSTATPFCSASEAKNRCEKK